MASAEKLQRWVDLLAALLRRHYGATFEQLRADVPAYASGADAKALERMFERDKDELRAIGIPIATKEQPDGDPQKYTIDPAEMYLPYLMLASGSDQKRAVGLKAGYRALPTLQFQPDELRALLAGAREAMAIGEPAIAADASSALRKLAYDLDVPMGSVAGEGDGSVITPREPATAPKIHALGEALMRLKRVEFVYHSMSSDQRAARTVEPYGLFFQSGHWYLAARDVDKGDVRNFRVSRLEKIAVNRKKPQSTDYSIPATFRLAEHARAREPWELGDGAAEEMIVEFRGDSGPSHAALGLGEACDAGDRCRAFKVRRIDSFARWLLSFAGEVVPVAPRSLVDEFSRVARSTLGVYESRS